MSPLNTRFETSYSRKYLTLMRRHPTDDVIIFTQIGPYTKPNITAIEVQHHLPDGFHELNRMPIASHRRADQYNSGRGKDPICCANG